VSDALTTAEFLATARGRRLAYGYDFTCPACGCHVISDWKIDADRTKGHVTCSKCDAQHEVYPERPC